MTNPCISTTVKQPTRELLSTLSPNASCAMDLMKKLLQECFSSNEEMS